MLTENLATENRSFGVIRTAFSALRETIIAQLLQKRSLSMSRKYGFGLFLTSFLFTQSVFGLGLGEASVESALNQPLKARIELVNVDGLAEEEILPGLATREEFSRVGVERVFFLSEMKFEVLKGADGEPYVELTSKAPVREPFLNFIVEVIWPAGRMLREYALLIDPPLFIGEEDKTSVAPAITPLQCKKFKLHHSLLQWLNLRRARRWRFHHLL